MQSPVKELLGFFREENAVSGKDLKIGREGSFLLEVLNENEAQRIRLRVSSDVELKLEKDWFTVERVSWLDGKKEMRQVPAAPRAQKSENHRRPYFAGDFYQRRRRGVFLEVF